MKEYIKTYEIKQTAYYETLTEKQKEDLEFFMEWLQYLEVVSEKSPTISNGAGLEAVAESVKVPSHG